MQSQVAFEKQQIANLLTATDTFITKLLNSYFAVVREYSGTPAANQTLHYLFAVLFWFATKAKSKQDQFFLDEMVKTYVAAGYWHDYLEFAKQLAPTHMQPLASPTANDQQTGGSLKKSYLYIVLLALWLCYMTQKAEGLHMDFLTALDERMAMDFGGDKENSMAGMYFALLMPMFNVLGSCVYQSLTVGLSNSAIKQHVIPKYETLAAKDKLAPIDKNSLGVSPLNMIDTFQIDIHNPDFMTTIKYHAAQVFATVAIKDLPSSSDRSTPIILNFVMGFNIGANGHAFNLLFNTTTKGVSVFDFDAYSRLFAAQQSATIYYSEPDFWNNTAFSQTAQFPQINKYTETPLQDYLKSVGANATMDNTKVYMEIGSNSFYGWGCSTLKTQSESILELLKGYSQILALFAHRFDQSNMKYLANKQQIDNTVRAMDPNYQTAAAATATQDDLDDIFGQYALNGGNGRSRRRKRRKKVKRSHIKRTKRLYK